MKHLILFIMVLVTIFLPVMSIAQTPSPPVTAAVYEVGLSPTDFGGVYNGVGWKFGTTALFSTMTAGGSVNGNSKDLYISGSLGTNLYTNPTVDVSVNPGLRWHYADPGINDIAVTGFLQVQYKPPATSLGIAANSGVVWQASSSTPVIDVGVQHKLTLYVYLN